MRLRARILGDDDAAWRRIEHALLVARRNESAYDLALTQFMAAIHGIHVNNLALAVELSNEDLAATSRTGKTERLRRVSVFLDRFKA
jgi:hypothetical protein